MGYNIFCFSDPPVPAIPDLLGDCLLSQKKKIESYFMAKIYKVGNTDLCTFEKYVLWSLFLETLRFPSLIGGVEFIFGSSKNSETLH